MLLKMLTLRLCFTWRNAAKNVDVTLVCFCLQHTITGLDSSYASATKHTQVCVCVFL